MVSLKEENCLRMFTVISLVYCVSMKKNISKKEMLLWYDDMESP